MIICPSARGVLHGGEAPDFWNPSDKGADVTLSNGNRTATWADNVGTGTTVRSVRSHATGKYYFEWEYTDVDHDNNTPYVGLHDNGTLETAFFSEFNGNGYAQFLGNTPDRLLLGYPGNIATMQTTTILTSDVGMLAWDADSGKFWLGLNGTWQGAGNPGAGTNPLLTGVTGTFYLAASIFDSACNGRFAAASWGYTSPAGFDPW